MLKQIKFQIKSVYEIFYISDIEQYWSFCDFNFQFEGGNVIYISLVIRQKGESQNGCFKKTRHAKFSEKGTFLTHTYLYKNFFFRKICRALFSWNTRFEIRTFALFPANSKFVHCNLPNLDFQNYPSIHRILHFRLKLQNDDERTFNYRWPNIWIYYLSGISCYVWGAKYVAIFAVIYVLFQISISVASSW